MRWLPAAVISSVLLLAGCATSLRTKRDLTLDPARVMELARQRAQSVRDALLKRHPEIAPERIELVGRGWEEPAGADSELNRRVEVQWFTLE